MPRSKTPKKSKKASAGPIDLNDPIINLAATVGTVAAVSICWNNDMAVNMPGDLTDGSLFNSITDNSKQLHAALPFSFMFLMHCLNSAKSDGGFWVADIVNCVFTAFGGLMMKDLLAGSFNMPSVFNNNLALLITCWYLVNHNLPFTKFNLWNTINDAVSKFLPIGNVMNLCTMMFNLSLLHEVASNQGSISGDLTADAFYGNIVVLAGAITWSVAHYCAGDFFSTDGFAFNVSGCSEAAERATLFAFWYASNGLANLPVLGGALGGVTSQVEGVFGGRANFLNMYVLVYALAGDMIPVNVQTLVQDFLYKTFGVSQ